MRPLRAREVRGKRGWIVNRFRIAMGVYADTVQHEHLIVGLRRLGHPPTPHVEHAVWTSLGKFRGVRMREHPMP
jgi:hypothetical protein